MHAVKADLQSAKESLAAYLDGLADDDTTDGPTEDEPVVEEPVVDEPVADPIG